MSTADRILGLIDQIAATSSRTEKETILVELLEDELGKFVVKWAYDPFTTFGLTPARQDPNGIDIGFRPDLVLPMLNELAERRLTGNAAQLEVAEVIASFERAGGELLYRILAKDLKCGIGIASINKVIPGFVPVFSVMRAHHFEEKRVKSFPQVIEPKYDGYRYTFLCRDGHGNFFSRNGIPQPSCEHLVEPMIETAIKAVQANVDLREMMDPQGVGQRKGLSFMVDGEMMVEGNFNATGALRRTSEKADTAFFQCFDIMSYADFDAVGSVGKPYLERRKLLEAFVSHCDDGAIREGERYFVNSLQDIQDFYERFRARGLEGAMVKNPAGLYDKKKSYGWMKIKPEETEDLRIVGFFNGKADGEFADTMGGAIVDRNGVEVRVGGGWSKEQREELNAAWDHDARLLGADVKPGFKGYTEAPVDVMNFKDQFKLQFLGRLVEVEYHEVTPDGSLRHPRFIRFRDDKDGEIESKEAA